MSSHPDNSHHALAGCGERLKQAREAAGLSIDDVAATVDALKVWQAVAAVPPARAAAAPAAPRWPED